VLWKGGLRRLVKKISGSASLKQRTRQRQIAKQ
jgi:hypothetical protein